MNFISLSIRPCRQQYKYFWISLVLLIHTFGLVQDIYAELKEDTVVSVHTRKNPDRNVQDVIVDGTKLFRVFGTTSMPAKQRAEEIAERIRQLSQDDTFNSSNIIVKEIEGLVWILANEEKLMAVTIEDARIEGDIPAYTLAKQVLLPKIVGAIESYRHEREKSVLIKRSAQAVVRTILLSLILFLLFWSFKKIDQLVERHFKRKIDELEAKSLQILQSKQIWSAMQLVIRLVRTFLILGVLYFFINFVLSLFPWTRYVSQTLLGYVIDPLLSMGQAIVNFLPNFFFLAILFFVIRYLLKITHAFFNGIDHGQIKINGFHSDWALPTYRIVRVLMIMLALVIAYPYIPGSGSEAFKGISILLGLLFSLGSSSLIANLIAGYTMTYRRAFKVGDRIKIGANRGEVTQIRLLVTHLRSFKNEEIIIPNSTILSGEIINYSSMAKKHGLILHTTVGIGYEVPWRQVEAMLLMAAERTDNLQRRSQAFVMQTGLGDFGINYELNVFCKKAEKMMQIYSDLHRNIQDVFNEYEVVIMTPHYTGDTEDPKFVPKDKWHISPAKPDS